jgi:hypothetical protein
MRAGREDYVAFPILWVGQGRVRSVPQVGELARLLGAKALTIAREGRLADAFPYIDTLSAMGAQMWGGSLDHYEAGCETRQVAAEFALDLLQDGRLAEVERSILCAKLVEWSTASRPLRCAFLGERECPHAKLANGMLIAVARSEGVQDYLASQMLPKGRLDRLCWDSRGRRHLGCGHPYAGPPEPGDCPGFLEEKLVSYVWTDCAAREALDVHQERMQLAQAAFAVLAWRGQNGSWPRGWYGLGQARPHSRSQAELARFAHLGGMYRAYDGSVVFAEAYDGGIARPRPLRLWRWWALGTPLKDSGAARRRWGAAGGIYFFTETETPVESGAP